MISKNYDSKQCEQKWQAEWEKSRIYAFDEKSSKKPFVIDTPPPFTSGVPHMGHVLWWTWNDIIARHKRMCGFNVLLPQGWDCHGLPTELRVEKEYEIRKTDKKFLEACNEWTEKCIRKMKDYMVRFGYSADWDYEYFTHSSEYVGFVQKTLVNLFNRKLIERVDHPVMWCTKCGTTLAKAEVGYVEKDGVLYHIKFNVKGTSDHIVIATTRPEMLPACVAVFIHPDDKRYSKFLDKKAILPIVNREVPIIPNKDVEMEFGTGVVYLCTYGDEMDIKWQKKYGLQAFNIITKEGLMNENATGVSGLKIIDARIRIMEQLGMLGLVEKEERFKHNVLCHTERQTCRNPIEFIPMKQWAIKVMDFSNDILKMSDDIKWYPEHMKIRLKNWVGSMDWNWIFSRQRAYGTPIPFWYCEECGKIYPPKSVPVDPRNEEYHLEKCGCGGKIVGEKDICDGWIDSSITPLIVSGYWKNKKTHDKLYPSSLRQQGHDIIRTWAYYTMVRCFLETGKKPWRSILVNSMILGPDNREMHKSLGNVVMPDDVLLKHGADTIRAGLIMMGVYGKDVAFSWKDMEFTYKFSTKLWNIFKFVAMSLDGFKLGKKQTPKNFMDIWILSKLQEKITKITESMEKFEFSAAFEELHDFIWHDLADNYIEFVKYRIYNNIDKESAQATLYNVLLDSIKMLAPIMPHLTEEIYGSYFAGFEKTKSIHAADWPKDGFVEKKKAEEAGETGEVAIKIVSAIRQFKTSKSLPLSAELSGLVIECDKATESKIRKVEEDIKGTMKIKSLSFAKALGGIEVPEIGKISIKI